MLNNPILEICITMIVGAYSSTYLLLYDGRDDGHFLMVGEFPLVFWDICSRRLHHLTLLIA